MWFLLFNRIATSIISYLNFKDWAVSVVLNGNKGWVSVNALLHLILIRKINSSKWLSYSPVMFLSRTCLQRLCANDCDDNIVLSLIWCHPHSTVYEQFSRTLFYVSKYFCVGFLLSCVIESVLCLSCSLICQILMFKKCLLWITFPRVVTF